MTIAGHDGDASAAAPGTPGAAAGIRRFVGDWVLLLIANGVTQGTLFLLVVVVARGLTTSLFGQFALYLTVVTVFNTAGQLGTRQVLVRDIAKSGGAIPVRRRLLLQAKLTGALLATSGAIAYAVLVEREQDVVVLLAIAVAVASSVCWDFLESVLIGREQIRRYVLACISSSLATLVVLTVARLKMTLATAMGAAAAAHLLRAVGYAVVTRRRARILPTGEEWGLRRLASESLPFYWQALITTATFQLPVLFLRQHSTLSEVGFFNAANKLSLGVLLLVTSMSTLLLPRVARAHARDLAELKRTVHSFLWLGGAGLVLLASLLAIVAPMLVEVVFGQNYRSSAPIFVLQSWYVVWMFVFNTIGTCLAATGQQRVLARFGTFYTAVLLICCWFGSHFGAFGLGLAYLASAVINMVYHWRYFSAHIVRTSVRYPLWILGSNALAWLCLPRLGALLALPLALALAAAPILRAEQRAAAIAALRRRPQARAA